MSNELCAQDPDAVLVDALRAGDAAAFESLVKRHGRRLLHVAQAITKNREDAEDVLQESLICVFKYVHTFRGDSRFATWVTRITVNQALSIKRRKTHKVVSFDESAELEDGTAIREIRAHEDTPEQICSQQEFASILRRLSMGVRPSSRRVVALQMENDLTEAEIAGVLRFSVAAVKSRLHRGRLDLRRRLGTYIPGPSAKCQSVGIS